MKDLGQARFSVSKNSIIVFLPDTPSNVQKNEIPQFTNQGIIRRSLPTIKEEFKIGGEDPFNI